MFSHSQKTILATIVVTIGVIGFIIFGLPALTPEKSANLSADKKVPPEEAPTTRPIKLSFAPPLPESNDRVTKKPFGLYVSPKNSPVTPEKFQGYHTGADFEVFENEEETPVPVVAVCSGKFLQKGSVAGYGGVAIQSCNLDGEPITVLYGHLKNDSLTKNPGDEVSPGDLIGVLGKGYTSETDGERKHVHIGFHKGTVVNFRGYVTNKNELLNWIDPCQYICQ